MPEKDLDQRFQQILEQMAQNGQVTIKDSGPVLTPEGVTNVNALKKEMTRIRKVRKPIRRVA